MNKLLIAVAFCATLGLQIVIPSKMIYDQSGAIHSGTPYKFKTRPIDPNDPFRGKYVALNFEMDSAQISDTTQIETRYLTGEQLYVILDTDSLGYASTADVSLAKPAAGVDYVVTKVRSTYKNTVWFDLPFDRFYMEEGKALEAQQLVRETNWARPTDSLAAPVCYALVYIKGDKSTLDNVFIDQLSLKEVVLNSRTQ